MHSRPFAPQAEGLWIFTTHISTDTTQGLWGWKEGLGISPAPACRCLTPLCSQPVWLGLRWRAVV